MNGKSFANHWDLIHEVIGEHLAESKVGYSTHALKRMEERTIEEASVKRILDSRPPHEMFAPYEYPYGDEPYENSDPVFSILGKRDKENWVVGVAMKKQCHKIKFWIVTMYRVDKQSRHLKRT